MLTDRELCTLKPREKTFKVADRDGMYAAVLPTRTISFRYDYRVNGRRETLAIGRYDADLARLSAREPAALEYGINLSLREARLCWTVPGGTWSGEYQFNMRTHGSVE